MTDVTFDDVLAETRAANTPDASISVLLDGVKVMLDQALSGATLTPAQQARVNRIFADLKANEGNLAAAVAENTSLAPKPPVVVEPETVTHTEFKGDPEFTPAPLPGNPAEHQVG